MDKAGEVLIIIFKCQMSVAIVSIHILIIYYFMRSHLKT